MHESMIWQYNQNFADAFTIGSLVDLNHITNLMGSLMSNILCAVSNPRAADLALQDAQKEQYKFLAKVQKMIARRAGN